MGRDGRRRARRDKRRLGPRPVMWEVRVEEKGPDEGEWDAWRVSGRWSIWARTDGKSPRSHSACRRFLPEMQQPRLLSLLTNSQSRACTQAPRPPAQFRAYHNENAMQQSPSNPSLTLLLPPPHPPPSRTASQRAAPPGRAMTRHSLCPAADEVCLDAEVAVEAQTAGRLHRMRRIGSASAKDLEVGRLGWTLSVRNLTAGKTRPPRHRGRHRAREALQPR